MGIDNLNGHKLLYAFIWGFKDQIFAEVHLWNPKCLEKAACIALYIDGLLHPPRDPNWKPPQHNGPKH